MREWLPGAAGACSADRSRAARCWLPANAADASASTQPSIRHLAVARQHRDAALARGQQHAAITRLRRIPAAPLTFSCASSITVIGPFGGLHDQVRHDAARGMDRRGIDHRAATYRTVTPACRKHVARAAAGGQRLLRAPATRLRASRARRLRRPAPVCGRNSQKPPPTSSASTTDAASAKRRAGAGAGACGMRAAAARARRAAGHPAPASRRGTGGTPRRWRDARVTSGGSACGSPPMCRRARGGSRCVAHSDVLRGLRGHRSRAAGCVRGTAASAPRPG